MLSYLFKAKNSSITNNDLMIGRASLLKKLPLNGIGIELGVAAGAFSKQILENSQLAYLYSIDMWAGDRGHDIEQYKFVIKHLEPFRQRNSVIRLRFDEALSLFPNSYFDFIYVDGYAHTGEENGQTFYDWFPKLKSGGIFSGDDYSPDWPLVVKAVDAFAAKNKLAINTVKSVGTREDGGVDYPSWYFIKP